MKRETLVCLFACILCLFCLSIPKVVWGQQSSLVNLVNTVFKKYEETFKHPDIQKNFPPVLRAFKDEGIQEVINSHVINQFVVEPSYIRAFYTNTDNSILQSLAIDPDFQALFRDDDFHKVLQNPTAIEQLAVLIENIQIPTALVKVSGDSQTGKTGNPLQDPFIVVVKDQNDNPIEGIPVTFRIISGEGEFLNEKPTTDSKGQARTTFTLGPTSGTTLIEARVDGIAETVFFTATATKTDIEVPPVVPKPSELVVSLSPSVIVSPKENKKVVLTVRIKGGEGITGYEITVEYNPAAIEYVTLEDKGPIFNCDYLPAAYQLKEKIDDKSGIVTLTAVSPFIESSGDGILAKLTFRVKEKMASTVTLANVNLSDSNGKLLSPTIPQSLKNSQIMDLNVDVNEDDSIDRDDLEEVLKNFGDSDKGDVNGDGDVNILDLVLVAQLVNSPAKTVSCSVPEDVNGDGQVTILDIILVASKIEESASAPSLYSLEQLDLSTADIQGLITQIKAFQRNGFDDSIANPTYQRGIAILEDLLKSLMQVQKEAPQKTELFVNYPNPFNPETWIPYQLGEATDVTVTIHAMNGSVVRKLSLGHQVAGMYRSKSRAAYWDGRNAFGEPVASGLYFYTLTAGNYSATHKMLIRK